MNTPTNAPESQLEVTDLFKGAYFLTQSIPIKETKLSGVDQVRFVFAGENLLKQEQNYQSGQAMVNPLHLKECLRFLRDKLKQTLKTKNPNWNRRTHAHPHHTREGNRPSQSR